MTTAIILAGGKGTRSANPSIPKIAQRIGGKSLLEWHRGLLDESKEIDSALIVAGHLGHDVEQLLLGLGRFTTPVDVVQEVDQRGTVSALVLGTKHAPDDRYLVMLGDILLGLPLDRFLQAWAHSGKGVAVCVHPSTHPTDSDAVYLDETGRAVVLRKGEPRDATPNMSSAGLFAITADALARYAEHKDLGSHVLKAAANDDDLFVYVSSHYFKDTGTPERLAAAENDVNSGAYARRSRSTGRRALFLDRDGVINPAVPDVYHPDQYELLPGVADAIRLANRAGLPVFVVTNQPGIAKGFMTPQAHLAIRTRMDYLLAEAGAFVDDYAFCPHHPESGFEGEVRELKIECDCRKPKPGLLLAVASRHCVDLTRSIFVGDRSVDAQASQAANCRFRLTSEAESARTIATAIQELTC